MCPISYASINNWWVRDVGALAGMVKILLADDLKEVKRTLKDRSVRLNCKPWKYADDLSQDLTHAFIRELHS